MEGHPLLVKPRLTEMRDTVTLFNLPVFIRDLGHSIFRAKSTNLKVILKRRDEAATLFSHAVCLQSSAPALNISVKCPISQNQR